MSDVTLTFEKSLERLEQIVTLLEDSKTPLDKLLELFEEGVKNVRYCTTSLEDAEKRVVSLSKSKDGSGEIVEVDFADSAQ